MSETNTQDIAPESAIANAFFLYRDAGLRLPPVPRELVDRLEEQAEWKYATDPVMLDDRGRFISAAASPDSAPLVAFGRAGHGIASLYLCYQLISAPLAVFVRQHFASPYGDLESERARANTTLIEIENLVVAADEARAAGRIGAAQRLLIMIDDVEGSGWHLLGIGGTEWHPTDTPVAAAMSFLTRPA